LNSSILEGRLSWEGALPLDWRTLDRLPEREQLGRTVERNIALLNALTLIEEGAVRQAEEPSPLVAQMERLEAKFDLVLTLLTEALLPESVAPGPVALRLSSRGVVFDAGESVEPGKVVEISIHFSASLPRPVVLYGIGIEPLPGEESHVSVEFRQLDPGVKERLERLVFRRHRRSIAQQRPKAAP
jgi:hypothetical protein